MNSQQWVTVKKCSMLEPGDKIPAALIVDSPWIPWYTGISTIDYLTMPDKWFDAKDFIMFIMHRLRNQFSDSLIYALSLVNLIYPNI